MKRTLNIYSLLAIVTLFGFSSCEKKSDNVTPQPVITIDSVSVTSPQASESGKMKGSSSIIVPLNSDIVLPFQVSAQGKLQQVDYKVTGTTNYTVLNSSNDPVTTQDVPFDWVGLMSIRTGFDSETSFNFSIIISNITEKTYVTIQAFDQNGLKYFANVVVYPASVTPSVNGLKLYSQNATAADAGGSETNRKMFLATSNGNTFDTTSAKVNTQIDIAFADSSGTAILVSPDYSQEATNYSPGVVQLDNGLATLFMSSPIDINQACLIKIENSNFETAEPYIQLVAGKSYLFKTSSGEIGIIKINSISAGSVSLNGNAVVDLDVKSYIPGQ